MVYRTAKWALASAGALVLAAGLARPASAADDGYQNVFSSVLTAVGVMPQGESADIDYRERAPLVLPPKQNLVKPQEAGATRTAAWPADPDVARRRKAAAEARAPLLGIRGKSDEDRLSKEEQLKFRAETPVEDPYSCENNRRQASCRTDRVDVADMKAQEERYKKQNHVTEKALKVGEDVPREYLTQPPKGYMKVTKEVEVTHEAPDVRKDDSSSLSTYIHPTTGKVDPLD